jgi:hypothetical protein
MATEKPGAPPKPRKTNDRARRHDADDHGQRVAHAGEDERNEEAEIDRQPHGEHENEPLAGNHQASIADADPSRHTFVLPGAAGPPMGRRPDLQRGAVPRG